MEPAIAQYPHLMQPSEAWKSIIYTFDPCCGQDFLGTEVLEHIGHCDATQSLHLLLEDHCIARLSQIVKLMIESA